MYYPYEEDQAGKLRSHYETSKASEYLVATEEIISLAKEVLPRETYSEAEQLARMLAGTKTQKKAARARLVEIVKPPPKRPIYYCQYEVQFLPRWTRDTLRYLGDFVDMLVKTAVYEKMRNDKVFELPLGPAIKQFNNCYPGNEQLADWLEKYNRSLYRGAKHDFKLPADRKEHRFTSREVVLSIFVTMELADRITNMSPMVARVRRDEPM